MTPEEALQQYHQKKAEREAENLKIQQQQADTKAKTTAYYADKKAQKKPIVVKTRKEHPCTKCGQTIPIGQKVIVETDYVLDRHYNPTYQCLYYCNSCKGSTPT